MRRSRDGIPTFRWADTLRYSAGSGGRHQIRVSTASTLRPQWIVSLLYHRTRRCSGMSLLIMIRKGEPFDRTHLTVNMKESSWYIQGTPMCLRRSLCGHHESFGYRRLDLRRPSPPITTEKTTVFRNCVSGCCMSRTDSTGVRLVSPVAC